MSINIYYADNIIDVTPENENLGIMKLVLLIDHEAAISAKDAEIAALKAENERLKDEVAFDNRDQYILDLERLLEKCKKQRDEQIFWHVASVYFSAQERDLYKAEITKNYEDELNSAVGQYHPNLGETKESK